MKKVFFPILLLIAACHWLGVKEVDVRIVGADAGVEAGK